MCDLCVAVEIPCNLVVVYNFLDFCRNKMSLLFSVRFWWQAFWEIFWQRCCVATCQTNAQPAKGENWYLSLEFHPACHKLSQQPQQQPVWMSVGQFRMNLNKLYCSHIFQIQGESQSALGGRGVRYRGVFGTLLTMVKTEGPRSLYSGLVAGLHRQMSFASVRIGMYDTIKQLYSRGSESRSYCHTVQLWSHSFLFELRFSSSNTQIALCLWNVSWDIIQIIEYIHFIYVLLLFSLASVLIDDIFWFLHSLLCKTSKHVEGG